MIQTRSLKKGGGSPTIRPLALRIWADVLVFLVFLFDITNLLRDGLEGVFVVGILHLQLCKKSAE